MALNLGTYQNLLRDIKSKKFGAIYLLHGEEPFFIDKLSDAIEQYALEDFEKEFNQTILYGRDTKAAQLIETVKRFPMMAERQLVIVREAQHMSKELDKMEDYFNEPVASTILVLDFKYKKADGRKPWVKKLKKNEIVFESSKVADWDLPEFVGKMVSSKKYRINQRASILIAEYLGNDLEKIEMELEKIMISVPLSREISEADVRKHIGISKEYNIFEFVDALSSKDAPRAFKIATFFGRNDKNYPPYMILPFLFSHFSKTLVYQFNRGESQQKIMAALKIRSDFQLRNYQKCASNYPAKKTLEIVSMLREYDAMIKGVGVTNLSSAEMLKEMTYRILN